MNNEKILPFPPGGKPQSSTGSNAAEICINETSSLEAFIHSVPSVVERGNEAVEGFELLASAQRYGYQFVDIFESTAVVESHGHRYRIHSQALQIADFAIAVCRALTSETQSNGARADWMEARRRLQDKTNSIHSVGGGDNVGRI